MWYASLLRKVCLWRGFPTKITVCIGSADGIANSSRGWKGVSDITILTQQITMYIFKHLSGSSGLLIW